MSAPARLPDRADRSDQRPSVRVRGDGTPRPRHRASPWCRATTAFRDRLRTDPATRRAHEEVKDQAARDHAGDPDHDDYTRAKSSFITSHR
uniref:GrpB family protein n=1 Tax=Saccharothrix mutabilis TaxID=33921 RepID=UPI0031E2E047